MTDTALRKNLRQYSVEPTDDLAHRIASQVLRSEPVSKYEGQGGSFIKIRYDEGETGWAQDLGGGIARICNNPLTPDIRNGDIVTTKMGDDGWKTWNEIVERKYSQYAILRYKDTKYYYILSGACSVKGWSLEGGIAPRNDNEGFATIQYNGEGELEPFLERLGLQKHFTVTSVED